MVTPYPRIYIDKIEFEQGCNTISKFCRPKGDNGDYVYQLIGKKKFVTRRQKPFEVGKTYKNGRGEDVHILTTSHRSCDGRLLIVGSTAVGDHDSINFYSIKGQYGTANTDWDLIPEFEEIEDITPIETWERL